MFTLRRNVRFLRLCVNNFNEISIRNYVNNKCNSLSCLTNSLAKNEIFVSQRLFCTSENDAKKEAAISETSEKLDLEAITRNDPELLHKFKVLQLEIEVMRQDGVLVPDEGFMNTEHWKELLQLPSRSQRQRYLQYLFKVSKRKENRKLKKEKMQKQRELDPPVQEPLQEGEIRYGLQYNTIFIRFSDIAINQMYNNRLIQAMQFGQKIVIDCGYDDFMTKRENLNCARQIMLLFGENRIHHDPFDIHLCNTNFEGLLMNSLHRCIRTLYEPWFPLNLHQESYLDLFPKEQLIYLTPHCKEEMEAYDNDAVYIVGGIVDKVNQQPLSLAKAKKEGIRMQKFPLDRYLQWAGGSGKSLTLNHVISIMLDIKLTGDWKYSLRHVPRRKIADEEMLCPNLMKAADDLRYDRDLPKSRFKRKWIPISNLDNLTHNRSTQQEKKNENDRLVDLKNILQNK